MIKLKICSLQANNLQIKLRLPICEIWCDIYQLFRSFVYFILPFTDVRNSSDRK